MKISDILKRGRPSVSFEVFPPKRQPVEMASQAMEQVKASVREIATMGPAFMSVTYGAAGGSTGVNTAEIADFVQNECGVPALAHLTCITSRRDQIETEISVLRRVGVENVLCLRGDYPPDADPATFPSDFAHAVDLVRELRRSGFCLGGACYPECHPECDHISDDIAYLIEKVSAGLDFLTTQMFFDNNVYYRYLARLRDAGITIPVVAGIMPVTNSRQIERICKLSGTMLTPRFKAIVDRFGNDPGAMLDAGVAYATEQIIDLFANGVDNVHVYTMNRPEVAGRIMRNLGSVLKVGD